MRTMKEYKLVWAPSSQIIGTVRATTPRAAIRKAPKPYRKYLGEIYAIDVTYSGKVGE